MSTISITLNCTQHKFTSKKYWACDIGSTRIEGQTKADLAENVKAHLIACVEDPAVGMARVGNEVMIAVSHGGTTTSYVADCHDDGVVPLRSTCFSHRPVQQETDGNARHLFEGKWKVEDGPRVPRGMPASQVEQFTSWVGHQLALVKNTLFRSCTPS